MERSGRRAPPSVGAKPTHSPDPVEQALANDFGVKQGRAQSTTVADIWTEESQYNTRANYFWASFPFVVILIPAYLSYRRDHDLAQEAQSKKSWSKTILKRFRFAVAEGEQPDRALLDAVMRHTLSDKLGQGYKSTVSAISRFSDDTCQLVSRNYLWAAEWYLNLPTGKMAVVPIVALNTAIFLSWNLSALRPSWRIFMYRNFTDMHHSWRRPWTVYMASFSHSSLMHFGFNQYAMWSVGAAALALGTQEQIDRSKAAGGQAPKAPPETDLKYQLWAAFLTAAVCGSSVSRVSSKISLVRLMRRALASPQDLTLHRKVQENVMGRSLGSSAGVYGLFAAAAVQYGTGPDAGWHRIGFIGLPAEWSLPMGQGFLLLCCFDAICLVTGFKFFDHAAHLGGAAAGALWALWIQGKVWIPVREWWAKGEMSRQVMQQGTGREAVRSVGQDSGREPSEGRRI